MRIVVAIKQVPETKSVRMDEKTGTVIREGVAAIINPLDLYAIELALLLREEHGGEVVGVSMGPPKAVTALREALAMGLDSAILVSDAAFAGSDTWATSYVLSQAIRKIGEFDLVICGERATDGDTGQVGPGIASFLNLPVISYVSQVRQAAGGICRVNRLVEDGYEHLYTSMPAVLTVVKEVANPRLPTLRGKQRARQATIPTWTAADLQTQKDKIGLNGSPTRVVKIHKPVITRQCRLISARDEAAARAAAGELLQLFAQQGITAK